MPNLCMYSMCVKGKKENIEEFIKVIEANYNYGTMEFSYDRHFFRVFESYYDEIEHVKDDIYQVIIGGDCAWSVSSCMFDNHSLGYYATFKKDYGDKCRGTTLPIESKNLNLSIEVYSEECGMCFQEHYVIINGDVVVDECVDWYEYYLRDYATKSEAEEELEIEITDEEWNGQDDYVSRGGFDNWDFTI